MNTLVIYASKYGTTKSLAEKINNSFENSELISCSKLSTRSLISYDRIIIGTSFYFGKTNKNLIKWIKNNKETLLNKELHFFTCSKETTLEPSIPKEIYTHAIQNCHFGYELKISQMSFIHKFVAKKIAQTSNDENHLKPEQINLFISSLKSS